MFVCIGLLQIAAQSFTYTDDRGVAWGCSVTSSEDKTAQITSASGFGAEVVIPEKVYDGTVEYTVTSIAEQLFKDNTTIEKVTWPSTVTTIPEDMFAGCSKLSNVIGMGNVETVSDYAFENCKSLQSVDLSSCKSISNYAFLGCSKLSNVIGIGNVETIGENAFYECTALQSINLMNCTSIGNYAFFKCKELQYVELPKIKNLGNYAFNGTSIFRVILPEKLKDIGYKCFNAFDYMFSGIVPPTLIINNNYPNDFVEASIMRVPKEALETYKTAVGWSKYADKIFSSSEKFDYEVKVTALDNKSVLEQTIGATNMKKVFTLKVTGAINSYDIFMIRNKMTNLYNLDLTDADIVANNFAYYDSYSTQDNEVGNYMFYNLNNLFLLKLPKKVKYIGKFAVARCSNLVKVDFPKDLKSIDEGAFNECRMLDNVILPNGLESIGNNTNSTLYAPSAFLDCTNLKNLQLPPSLKKIYYGAFQGCRALKIINFPGLDYIGKYAFYNCSSLTEVRFPNTLYEIENGAFSGCTSLTDIYTYTIEPISIGQNTFDETTYKNARLWMPTQSYTNYYYNTQWGQFDNEKYNWFDEPYKYFYINNEYTLSDENSASKDKGRFDGDPDIDINPGGGLIVEGDKDQGADDIHLKADGTNWATIIAKANVDAKRIYIDINVKANRWHFFCFPFDVKRSNISCSGSFVFRYYNGKTRAEKGFGGWTDLPASEEYLKAGKGYIFQTSADCTLSILIEKEKFGKLPNVKFDCNLEANASTNEQDASWNFVGNPFTSFFDLNDISYDAPLTRWNGSSYEAVRPGDDDYIFHPYEAFFVQRPADSDNIEFAPEHRMTQTGRDNRAAANALRAMKRQLNPGRLIVNLQMTDGEAVDKTRMVFNPAKSNKYERDCDAAKFESAASAVQLYTVEAQGGKMAINERPAGSVQLGYRAKTAGDYTISALRMDQPVLLRDNVMNITHDLSNADYTFSTDAGTFDNRFMLLIDGTTGIADIANGTGVNVMPTANGLNLNGVDGKTVNVYSISGALTATRSESGFLNLAKGVYIVEVGKMRAKVMVK